MNRPIKLLIVVAVLFCVAFQAVFGQADSKNAMPDPYREAIATARTEVWKAIGSGLTSSATVAFIDDGKIIYSEGFGMRDRINSIPVDAHTQFNIGSIGKVFTATAVLLLVQDGKVELGVYCNDGFTFAEGIIERMSGESFSSFIASRIFAKFGMYDSSCFFKAGNDNIALVYDPATGKAKPVEFVSVLGSGGISSTAEDLCRFSTPIPSFRIRKAAIWPQYDARGHAPLSVRSRLGYGHARCFPEARYHRPHEKWRDAAVQFTALCRPARKNSPGDHRRGRGGCGGNFGQNSAEAA